MAKYESRAIIGMTIETDCISLALAAFKEELACTVEEETDPDGIDE